MVLEWSRPLTHARHLMAALMMAVVLVSLGFFFNLKNGCIVEVILCTIKVHDNDLISSLKSHLKIHFFSLAFGYVDVA